jgi:hypothetical protein
MNIGDQVKVKATGDEEIDQYVGQVGTIAKIETPTVQGRLMGDNVTHYFVTMSDGKMIVINEDEFDAV